MVAARKRPTGGDLLTVSEAAALAGVHRNTIRTWCASGRIGYVRVNRRGDRRLRRTDLERVAAARAGQAASPDQGRAAAQDARRGRRTNSTRRLHLVPGHPDRAGAFRRIAADISGRVDLDKLFEDLIDDSFALFRVDEAGMWLYDGSEYPLRIAAQRGLSPEILDEVARLHRRAQTAGLRAIDEQRVITLGDSLEGTSPALRELYRRNGIRTVCLVPVVFRDEPLGLIAFYHHRPYAWTDEEMALARSFADATAAALGNARLYESVQSLAARLDAINELAIRLNRIQDTAQIGEAIIAAARQLIAFDTIRVYRVDRESAMCEPIAFSGRFVETTRPTADILRVPVGTGLTGWVAAHNESLLVGDAERDPRGVLAGTVDQPESMLLVPMSYEGEVHGVIVVSQVGFDRFTRDDEQILSIFAGYAAQALINAERLEQVRRQQAELELQLASQRRLLEVNERLLSTLDPSGVLEMVADSLSEVVAYDSLTIYRIDRERDVRYAVLARDRFADVILDYSSPIDVGINGWVIEHQEAVLANDVHLDTRSVQIPGTPDLPESMVVVPLVVHGTVIGTLALSRIGEDQAHFSQNEFELTKLFAAQASIALQNAEKHGEIKVLADHDALTGLRNHGAFQRELGQSLADERLHGLALLMMDLDNFKAYNDTLGHPAGDALLAGIALALRGAVRDGDALYRYGGDEFAVILPGADRAAAQDVAERISGAIANLPKPPRAPLVGVSVGIACYPEDGRAKDELVAFADDALYLAKPWSRYADTGSARDPYLAALDETALALMERLDPNKLLETIMARAAALVGTPNGYIYLIDDESGALVCRIGIGFCAGFVGYRLLEGQGVAGTVLRTRLPFVVDDYDGWSGRVRQFKHERFGSVMGVPLTSGTTVVGVIGLASGDPARPYGEREVAALNRFAQLASIALDNARLADQARRGALYDAITGLPNRDLLMDRVAHALSAAPEARPIGVMLLDLDRFKVINESLGHAMGDRLLLAVGQRLTSSLRPGDTAARFGGDEFGILLDPIAGPEEAERIALRIDAELAAPFDLGGRDWFVGASIGIAIGRAGKSPGDLFREAEIALYRAKADATRSHALFEPSMSTMTLERVDLENDLRRAIERGELRVHYQPIVDLATDTVVGLEALVRWQHPVRGLVPPASFIPLAEETGLIVPLGWHVLERACRDAAEWRRAFPGLRLSMSVNLSARQFAQPDLVSHIARVLRRTRLPRRALELEITESVLMDESELGTQRLRALRDLGVRLSLDDFGTGYSSLSYLKNLPLDTVKIDRSFIANLESGGGDGPIVEAVVALARGLGIAVVAEGIETRGQAEVLRGLGCTLGQGFLFSSAQPADNVPTILAAGARGARRRAVRRTA